MRKPRRSLVIPVYREAHRIEPSLRRLGESEFAADGTEVIVADDGSDDQTTAIVERLLGELFQCGRLVRRGRHLGKGSAVRGGVLAAAGEVVVFTDADLSTDIDDIIACFDMLEANQADVVFASRSHRESSIAKLPPHHRAFAGRTYNRLLRTLGLTTNLDTQCGLKGFRSWTIPLIFTNLRTNGFAFDVEILARAERMDMRVEPMPVAWSHVEASRVRAFRDGLSMAADALRIRARLAFFRSPTGAGQHTTMTDDDVAAMAVRERDHWWFAAKRDLVSIAVADLGAGSRILDVGAGGGAMVADLRASGHLAWGTDLSMVSARRSRERRADATGVVADAAALPVRADSMDVVVSLDVLEHLDDDVAALKGYLRVLKPGGRLVVSVPAYEWAWGDHDVKLGHRRRYHASDLRTALMAAGLCVDRVTYFHSFLVPPAAVLRRTPLGRMVPDQEEASQGPTVSRALQALSLAERSLLNQMDLPFGLSLFALAHRPVAVDSPG